MLIHVFQSIKVVNATRKRVDGIQLVPELYQNLLVVRPVDVQKWFLLSPDSALVPVGRMRRIHRNSEFYQLQPLQRTTTSWEVGNVFRPEGIRWVRIDVTSDAQNPHSVSVTLTPIYDCDRVSQIGFDIRNFDFRTRIRTEEVEVSQSTTPEVSQKAPRLSRYQRPLVI